ncbi:hypothetical protein FMUBM48_15040 [Nocardia cyriacigeorgica]|nr:hypothetical protein FMUBM48_15040 [Nocardia cyriacigeorgica]
MILGVESVATVLAAGAGLLSARPANAEASIGNISELAACAVSASCAALSASGADTGSDRAGGNSARSAVVAGRVPVAGEVADIGPAAGEATAAAAGPWENEPCDGAVSRAAGVGAEGPPSVVVLGGDMPLFPVAAFDGG